MKTGSMAFMLLVFLSSCSYFKEKGKTSGENLVIRYINLKAVYDFSLNRNQDALRIKTKVDELIVVLKEQEEQLADPAQDHQKLLDQYRSTRKKLERLKKRSAQYKEKILNQIHIAVKNVAREIKADYILNIGEDLVYAKRDHDVTEEVMKEIQRLDKRDAPVSR